MGRNYNKIRLIYKGSHHQVMIIEIELQKDIPSFLYFDGEKLEVNYLAQPQTCSVC